MPYLQFDVPNHYPVEVKRGLARRLGKKYARIMQTTPDMVTVTFRELGEGGVWRCSAGEPEPAAVLSCDIRRGRPPKQRAELAEALIDACVETLGLRSDRLVVEFTTPLLTPASARAEDARQADAEPLNGNGFYRFKIGDFQATVISDGYGQLPIWPIFAMNAMDGHAYINCGRTVTRDPDTGAQNDGFQRLMFRTPNLVNVGMQDLSHGGSIHGDRNHDMGQDMPVAVCVGGPALDLISALMRLPEQAIDAWDKLGGFLGGPAKVVKCETSDLTIPANAEIVLEGRVLTREGRDHDEGGYGEWTGTYGGGLPHNWNMVVDCITYRRDAIYQHASIGGLHPGRTDTSNVCAAAVEGELYMTLRHVGLHVLDVHVPEATCVEVAYARIKPRSGGDAKRALGTMLSACRQVGPKLAYVFDEDVDIFDDERVKWAQAWRYNPGTDTVLIPGQYVSPLDPSITQTHFPFSITKIGFDCTIPLGGDRGKFVAATVSPPIKQPVSVKPLDEAALVEQMTAFIKQAPRTWYEILQHFAGQPYPPVYRAFGKLRPKLGRRVDLVPAFPYTFADTEFVQGDGRPE